MHLNRSTLCTTCHSLQAIWNVHFVSVFSAMWACLDFNGLSFVQSQLKRLSSRSAQSVGVGLHSSLPRPVCVFGSIKHQHLTCKCIFRIFLHICNFDFPVQIAYPMHVCVVNRLVVYQFYKGFSCLWVLSFVAMLPTKWGILFSSTSYTSTLTLFSFTSTLNVVLRFYFFIYTQTRTILARVGGQSYRLV